MKKGTGLDKSSILYMSSAAEISLSQQFVRLLIGPIFSLPTAAFRFLHVRCDSELFCLQFAFPALTENVIMRRKTAIITNGTQTRDRIHRIVPSVAPHRLQTSLLVLSLRSFLSCSLSKQDVCVSTGQPGAEQHKADDQIAALWSCPVLPGSAVAD